MSRSQLFTAPRTVLMVACLAIVAFEHHECNTDNSVSSEANQASETGVNLQNLDAFQLKRQYLFAQPRIGRSANEASHQPTPNSPFILYSTANRRAIGPRGGGLLAQARVGRSSTPMGLLPQARVGRSPPSGSLIDRLYAMMSSNQLESSNDGPDSRQEIAVEAPNDNSLYPMVEWA